MRNETSATDGDRFRSAGRSAVSSDCTFRSGGTRGKFRFDVCLRTIFAVGMLALGSLSAKAVTTYTTYTPPDADLGDLDHHAAYMWTISGIATAPTYSSATLTIKNINNWDITKNILYIHLFDSAKTTGLDLNVVTVLGSGNNILTSFDDATGTPVTTLSDAFKASSLTSNPLDNASNDNNILLGTYVDGRFASTTSTTGYSYSTTGTTYPAVTITNYNSVGTNLTSNTGAYLPNVNSTFTPPASDEAHNPAIATLTFTFSAAQLATLNAYIDNGGSISLAFDSDCHFDNDGVTFTLGQTLSPVPEGSALWPLAGILALVGGQQYLRRRKVEPAALAAH